MIYFPKPLDYALLQHEIEVTGVTGKVSVARDETEWALALDRVVGVLDGLARRHGLPERAA